MLDRSGTDEAPVTSDSEIILDVGYSWVTHRITDRCERQEPHAIDECGEFDPPRPGYEPPAELPRRPLRYMTNWPYTFDALARGVSIFDLISEFAQRPID